MGYIPIAVTERFVLIKKVCVNNVTEIADKKDTMSSQLKSMIKCTKRFRFKKIIFLLATKKKFLNPFHNDFLFLMIVY